MSGPVAPQLNDDYLAALLAGDALRARRLVDAGIEGGLSITDVYLDVLTPALEEIGRRWEDGEVGVAWEHRATAITQGILGALGPRMRVAPTSGRLAVVSCTEGELHDLGGRMVADVLEAAGWEVILLGASVPSESLAALVEDEAPDVVALSTSTLRGLPGAGSAFHHLRDVDPTPWIVAGGRAWREPGAPDPRALGADATFPDPVALARDLAERFPPLPDDVL